MLATPLPPPPSVDPQHRIEELKLELAAARAKVTHMCSVLGLLRDHLNGRSCCSVGRGCEACEDAAAVCRECIDEMCPPKEKP